MSEICASCLEFSIDKIIKSNRDLKPKWLSEIDYVEKFIDSVENFNNDIPANANIKITVDVGKSHIGKKILYWGADEKEHNTPIVKNALPAYNNFSNHGITKVDNKGNVTFKLRCPQIYSTTAVNKSKEKTYFRHMHFVIEGKNGWNKQIYTKIIVCKHDFKKSMTLLNNGYTVFINALPAQYYAQDHIPNSYNLFHSDIKKMSQEKLFEWFKNIIKLHYPKLHTYIKNKKIDIYEIPIVTYCAHSKCNASELALEELLKKGFVNVNEYSGGIKDYRKNKKHD